MTNIWTKRRQECAWTSSTCPRVMTFHVGTGKLDTSRSHALKTSRTKIVLGQCPHRSPEWHKLSFKYKKKKNGDKQQPGVNHKTFDPHQSRKKGMGCGWFLSPKENHPVNHRRTDCSWLSFAAQGASEPR